MRIKLVVIITLYFMNIMSKNLKCCNYHLAGLFKLSVIVWAFNNWPIVQSYSRILTAQWIGLNPMWARSISSLWPNIVHAKQLKPKIKTKIEVNSSLWIPQSAEKHFWECCRNEIYYYNNSGKKRVKKTSFNFLLKFLSFNLKRIVFTYLGAF